MTSDTATRAASLLLQARRSGHPLDCLPMDCAPSTPEQGYDIQESFLNQLGGEGVGYKIGATSEAAQAFLGLGHPFSGRVLASNLFESPAELVADSFLFRLIEPEFAFRLDSPLPARSAAYGIAEVESAVGAVTPAIEVVTSAFGNWQTQGAAALISDNGVNGALVLGEPCEDWRALNLAEHRVSLSINGEFLGDGFGNQALGHPLNALLWLVNSLNERGQGVAAGEIVSTGVVTPFHQLERGDRAVADFGSLGLVEVCFL